MSYSQQSQIYLNSLGSEKFIRNLKAARTSLLLTKKTYRIERDTYYGQHNIAFETPYDLNSSKTILL